MQHKPARLLRLVDGNFPSGLGLRIAIATRDFRHVSEPFGRAVLLAVYDVSDRASELVSVIEFEPLLQRCNAANDNPDNCDGRVGSRLDALPGCHILVARQIGDVAAAAAMKRHIHPIELSRDEPIAALIARCQTMLSSNPPPWLRRAMAGMAMPADDGPEVDAAQALQPLSAAAAGIATVH